MWKRFLNIAYKTGRKIVVAVAGTTTLIIGVVLIFTPGPAVVVIPAGLAVLAVEFAWARRWLRKLRGQAACSRQLAERGNDSRPAD